MSNHHNHFPNTARTLEIFVESLLQKACQVTRNRNAKTLSPAHIKATINAENQFAFLREMVASIPDIQPSNDDEGHPLDAQLASATNSLPSKKRNKTKSSTVSRSSRATTTRNKKTGNHSRVQSVSRDEEDDDEDMDDDEDEDDDEGSSCDNSSSTGNDKTHSALAVPTSFPSSSLPSSSLSRPVNAADLVDDDYDDV